MSLTLLLMRHGKSDWSASYDTDAHRPLNGRGREAAKLMGRFLSVAGQPPDFGLTSTARRARDTLDLAHRAGGWQCPIAARAELYGHGPAAAFHVLRTSVPRSANVVLSVGHEPTWSEVVELLTGAAVRFPTAAIARIDLDVDGWDALAARTGELAWLIPPRLLKRAKKA